MIYSFTFNPFQENTYIIVAENNEAIIIDPGMYDAQEEQYFLDFINKKNITPVKLWLTHAHLDHVFGLPFTCKQWGLTAELHKDEKFIYDNAQQSAAFYGVRMKDLPLPSYSLKENTFVSFNGIEIEMRHTPGHSPGSLSFVLSNYKEAIVGDALFNGSIGRTDLPGGDHHQLLNAIKSELFTLPDDFTVYSGHGPTTTIGKEKVNNPFF
jgi:glyoxylase-like metal-dependent hydrolase (beta-lactamase superfamily II)